MTTSISLKPTALKEAIDTKSLVLFHAPWCGHCTKFKPTYDAFADVAKSQFPDVYVTKIDFDKYGDDVRPLLVGGASTVGSLVTGFPTVVAFNHGEYKTYDQKRTVDGLVEFTKQFFGASQTMSDSEEEYFQQ